MDQEQRGHRLFRSPAQGDERAGAGVPTIFHGVHMSGQPGHVGPFEQGGEPRIASRPLAQAQCQAHGGQGIAAQREEVCVPARRRIQLQDFGV